MVDQLGVVFGYADASVVVPLLAPVAHDHAAFDVVLTLLADAVKRGVFVFIVESGGGRRWGFEFDPAS